MDKYIYILIKPDAFLKKIVEEIIKELSALGLEICSANIIKPNRRLLELMYDDEFKWEYDYYEHNKKIYDLGPALSLISRYNSKIDYRKVKGSSLPIEAAPNSIRHMFGVKDRCLNLIHIADSVKRSQIEINEIYGDIDNYIVDANRDILKKMVKDNLLSLNNEKLHYKQVMENIQRRIANRINCRLYFEEEKYKPYNIEEIFSSSFKNKIPDDLRKIVDLGNKMGKNLTKTESSEALRFFEYFFAELEKRMIYISDLEKYILIGQSYYNNVNI